MQKYCVFTAGRLRAPLRAPGGHLAGTQRDAHAGNAGHHDSQGPEVLSVQGCQRKATLDKRTPLSSPPRTSVWKMCFRSGGGMSGSVPSFTVKFCIGAFLIEAVKWIAKSSASERAAGKARLSG